VKEANSEDAGRGETAVGGRDGGGVGDMEGEVEVLGIKRLGERVI